MNEDGVCTRGVKKGEVCDYPVMKCPGCNHPHIGDVNTNSKEAKINLEDLVKTSNEVCRLFEEGLIKSFCGIPIRVDKELSGFDYYISVSPKLKDLLENGI